MNSIGEVIHAYLDFLRVRVETTKFVAYYGRTMRFKSTHLRGVVASVLRRPKAPELKKAA
jgi:hypothetical protein